MTTLTAGKIGGIRGSAIVAWFSRWAEKRRARRERRQAVISLQGLNKAMLRDIGIDATEITSVVYSQPKGRRMTHDRF